MSDLQKDCLSFGDALFLHLERPGMPLHVAALCLFDGHIELEELIEHVRSKLPLIPRYQQKVIPPPYGIGIPLWQHDPGFNIRNHIREVILAKGTERELNAEVSRCLSEVMDRQKPLWDLTLFRGLKSGQTAMLARLHHCLADGISGIGILQVMLDTTPKVTRSPSPKSSPASKARDQASIFLDNVATTCFSTVERLLTAQSEMLKMAQHAFAVSTQVANGGNGQSSNGSNGGNVLAELARVLPEFASPPERLPFNIVCQGPQKYAYTTVPFQQIRAIKRKTESTVNDVVLTIVASAMRKYAQAHGISTAKRLIRIVVPVSVRTDRYTGDLGNQITFLPVTVPLGIKAPLQLLRAVHERMQLLKAAKVAELIAFAGTILGTIPNAVSALLGPIASQLPLSVCNLICTNVPGPQSPLYLLGRKMLTFYPYVPIGGEMGMNIAVLSYDGTMYVGFTGDAKAIPDVEILPKLLNESFVELQRVAGVARERTRPKPVAKKRVPQPKPAVVEEIPEPASAMAATA